MSPPTIEQLLDQHRHRLPGLVRKFGADLLRMESVHDLMQEIELKLLRAGHFEYQGEPQFLSLLSTAAQQVISNRRKFWRARRRDARNVFRISTGQQSGEFRGVDPASPFPTPSSMTARKELYVRVVRATGLLLERDRQVLSWMSEGRSIGETADYLACSYDAAAKARYRAISHLKKAYKIICNTEIADNL